jgi:hypothetical protein
MRPVYIDGAVPPEANRKRFAPDPGWDPLNKRA